MSRAVVIAHSSPSSSTVEPESRNRRERAVAVAYLGFQVAQDALGFERAKKLTPLFFVFPHREFAAGSGERLFAGVPGDPGEFAIDLDDAAVDQADDHDSRRWPTRRSCAVWPRSRRYAVSLRASSP